MTTRNKRRYIFSIVAAVFLITTAYGQDNLVKDSAFIGVDSVPGRFFYLPQISNTGSVSTATGEQLYKMVTPNLSSTLFGQLNGLTVMQDLGEPGGDDANLSIRGVSSYGMSSLSAFKIFVDGFQVNYSYLRNLAPSEIEDISILKDAASLATFGMLGANGIIWVTTKKAVTAKSTTTLRLRSGIQQPVKLYKPLNSHDFANLYNQAASNDAGGTSWMPFYTQSEMEAYRNGTGVNVDWYENVLKKNGMYNDADLIFAGGSVKTKYNVIFNFGDQQGLYNVKRTDTSSNQTARRYGLRTNLNFELFDIFDIKVNLGARIEEQRMPNFGYTEWGGANGSWNFTSSPIWGNLVGYPSNIYPIKDTLSGSEHWSGNNTYPNNPLATISNQGWRYYKRRHLVGNFEVKEKLDGITEGLYATQAFSYNSLTASNYNKTSSYERYFNGSRSTTHLYTPPTASNLGTLYQEDWKQFAFTLGYDKKTSTGALKSTIGYQTSDYMGEGFFSLRQRYQNLNARANYTHLDKYVGEVAMSYFGTDVYAPGNRWGFYPAVSAAWIISNEDFLKNSSVINYLKLRASVGKTGYTDTDIGSIMQSQNGRLLYRQYFTGTTGMYTGDGQINSKGGLIPLYIANPEIFAEQSLKYNVGLDMAIVQQLLLNVDLYVDKRTGIITEDQTVPDSWGNYQIFTNLGEQTNKGVEVSLTYKNKVGAFGYSIRGMAAYNHNVINFMGEVLPKNDFTAQTGKIVGSRFGLEYDRFYDIDDFNPDGTLIASLPTPAFGSVQPGDLKYKDLDGDGVVDNDDRKVIGDPGIPKLYYSLNSELNYKNFDFSFLFQGIAGSTINLVSNQTRAFIANGNAFPIAMGAWAYYPSEGIDTRATATYPRLTLLANDNNYRSSDFWVKDRSYIRLRYVELGYSLPKAVLNRAKLDAFRIFVNATNPLLISKFERDYGMDPESTYGYPALKSYNLGLSVTF